MYKSTDIKNYSPELLPHQLYFIQRWGELFEKGPLHYRKLSYPCVRAVLKEAIQVVAHFKTEILYEHNLFEIFQEVVSALKNNKLILTNFNEDCSVVLTRLESFLADKNTFSNIDNPIQKFRKLELPLTLINGLLNKLENTDIPKLYSELLSKELAKPNLSYEFVDEYLELLMGELLYEGHHKQYLYSWGKGVLVNDDECSFIKRIERIAELGKKNKREFECFIKLNLPDGYESLFGTNGPLTFFDEPSRARTLLEEEHGEIARTYNYTSILEFFNVKKHIGRMKLCATDKVAAINLARDELISTTKLFRLENRHKQYDPGNLTEVAVLDVNSNEISVAHNVEIYQSGLMITKNVQYIKINLRSRQTNRYRGLDQLLQWCRVIQDSPKETGLVAMWSLMEYLFVTEPTNKRKNVVDHATPYIAQFYFKSLAFRCREIFKQHREINNKLIENAMERLGEKSIDRGKNEVKLHYLLQFIAENKELAMTIFDGDAISQRYVGFLNKCMQLRGRKLWFADYLSTLEKRIECDLLRAYRLRNILTHQAYVDKVFFEEIYEKLAYYLKLILDDLLYSMSLQPDNTFHQLVRIKKESYKDYLKNIKDIEEIDSYKHLLSTRSLLI